MKKTFFLFFFWKQTNHFVITKERFFLFPWVWVALKKICLILYVLYCLRQLEGTLFGTTNSITDNSCLSSQQVKQLFIFFRDFQSLVTSTNAPLILIRDVDGASKIMHEFFSGWALSSSCERVIFIDFVSYSSSQFIAVVPYRIQILALSSLHWPKILTKHL